MKIQEHLYPYFEEAGVKKIYQPNDIIYMQEEATTSLYLILKGRVRVFIITPSGEEITYDVLDRGCIFGESSFFQSSLRPTTVTAVTEVELISCKLVQLYPCFSESTELAIALMTMLSQTCDHVTALLKRAYSYNRYEKVASFLLEQTEYENKEKGIVDNTIPYTHEEIGATVGLSRVTTTKVLNEFMKKGYIQNQYGKVKVINRKALSQMLQ